MSALFFPYSAATALILRSRANFGFIRNWCGVSKDEGGPAFGSSFETRAALAPQDEGVGADDAGGASCAFA
jgi:hypothetical protein